MTNKTNTFPKLTTAQERAWQLVLDWHDEFVQHASDPAEYFISNSRKRGITRNVIPGTEATFNALVKKGMLVRLEHPNNHGWGHYSIHPDFVPEYFDDEPTTPAPEPAPAAAWHERAAWAVSDVPEPPQSIEDMVEPAAAPAQPSDTPNADTIRAIWKTYFEMVDEGYAAFAANMINKRRLSINHPLFDEIGNEVRAEWKARHNLNTPELQPVNNAPEFMLGDNVTPKEGEWAGRLCWICDIRHTGVTPMYLIRDKHGKWDTWFGAEELVMVADPANYQKNAPTSPTYDSLKALADKQDKYIRALEARVKELESDMERLAASELELVQQNTLLNSVVDRLGERAATLENAVHDACAEYGGDMADDAMHTLADTIGYPWN